MVSLKFWKRLLYSSLAATLVIGIPARGGCKKSGETASRPSPDTDTASKATGPNVVPEGRAKGFVRLSAEKSARYGAIDRETLFVPETHYTAGDKSVCIANVVQYGAKGDGVTDDYGAFNQAIKAAQNNGGGTVFVPEGVYYVGTPLGLPANVLLRGEYDSPETSGYGGGTTILTDYDATGLYSLPFISLSSCSGLRNIAVYYLNQDFAKPRDLAPCVGFGSRAIGTTLENVMIYNASYPLYLAGYGNACHVYNQVWATPLKIGLLSDNNGDVTSFINLYMDAKYYANCGFSGAPQSEQDREALYDALQEAVGFIFERHDTPYANSLYSHDIGTALIVRESSNPNRETWENSGGFAGGCLLYNFDFTGCHTGIQIEKVLVGCSFTKGRVETRGGANTAGVKVTKNFRTDAQFSAVDFAGCPQNVVYNDCANGNIQFVDCTFKDWSGNGVFSSAGNLYLSGCVFEKAGNEIMADGSRGLGVAGCTFAGTPEISVRKMAAENVLISPEPLQNSIGRPEVNYDYMVRKPAAASFDIFNAADYGLDPFGEDDCSAAINKALTAAGDNGGGIVYVPAGKYRLDKTLYVPEGVELRGPLETYHSNTVISPEQDVTFYIYGGAGQKEGDGAVVLEKNCGVLGLSFYYPEQNVSGYLEGEEYIPYPYTITAKGPGCWVRYTVCANSYYMLDFGSAPDTSDYVITGVRGQPLKVGIFGGSNSGTGRVEYCNFSLYEWCYGPLPYKPSFGPGTYDYEGMKTNAKWKAYVMDLLANCDYYLFGYNKNLLVYGNLAYATRCGLRFVEQDGKFTEQGKFFYHCTDIAGSTVKIERAGDLKFVVGFADCELDAGCGATVTTYSTGMNTVFEQCMTVKGGTLNLGGLLVYRTYPVFLTATGGTVNISGGMLVQPSDLLVDAAGGTVNVEGLVVRNPRGTVADTALFTVRQSDGGRVNVNGCMGTDTGMPWE